MTHRFPFPLPNGWFEVAPADALSGDRLLPLHYFERDFVAYRDAAGQARVLDAQCQARGRKNTRWITGSPQTQ